MPELSVVVPVYQAEAYLEQCVNSILAQDFRDFELILVDDGCTDGSPAICDRFANGDGRVKVVHQANQGSTMARQNGLACARGEYVTFADSDDWMDRDMYSRMMRLATVNDADVVAVGFVLESANGSENKGNAIGSGTYRSSETNRIEAEALSTGCFYTAGIIPSLCTKLFRRELVQDIRADVAVRMGDDAAITYPALLRAKCVVVDNDNHSYHYRVVASSLSRAYDPRYFVGIERLIDGLYDSLKDSPTMRAQLPYYMLFVANIGLDQLLSRRNRQSFFQKWAAIDGVVERLKFRERLRDIDYTRFSENQKREMRALVNGKTLRYMRIKYGQMLARKTQSMLQRNGAPR